MSDNVTPFRMTGDLFRAAEFRTDGRTLSGIAVPFHQPTSVSDGGPSYREAFHRAAFTKSLKERATYPLMALHPWAPGSRGPAMPLGGVTFRATPDHLEFEARLAQTQAADEALALVNDDVLRDVSIGFRAIRSTPSNDAGGPYVLRTEARLGELSLAITGTGQYPDARVLAVRHEHPSTQRLEALRRRLTLL